MRTNQQSQRQRTQNNPLNLGLFSVTSTRLLRGTLGPRNQVVGGADTWNTSNGGYGGGTYNHWFQVDLATEAWIIIRKLGLRPKYIQVSFYDLNKNPIEPRNIFDKDSIEVTVGGVSSYPYLGHAMNAQSYLYNNFDPNATDKGDNRYFRLPTGSYLICISTTRNELLDYVIELVIEFASMLSQYLLESGDEDYLVYESAINPSALADPENHIYFEDAE
jgi:hypothetical protein